MNIALNGVLAAGLRAGSVEEVCKPFSHSMKVYDEMLTGIQINSVINQGPVANKFTHPTRGLGRGGRPAK
jgi:hypothetical protein